MNESNFIESLRSFYNHIRRESIVPFENSEEKVITLKNYIRTSKIILINQHFHENT